VIDTPPAQILETLPPSPENAAVECLGRTFADDAARRAYFLERLREKLQDPGFRQTEGFPDADDEAILALSDPPYYTACPNPFLQEFVQHHGRPYDPDEPYHREPFAADVSEGKNDPIYNAHAYHTKVPHKALMRYILHYTRPGDLIFDGFCGTGMAGVAAQMCGAPDAEFRAQIEREMPGVQWGARRALLCDLSPAASFIAHCYNTAFDPGLFTAEARRILRTVQERYGWAYTTTVNGRSYPVDYFVFSDVFLCANCGGEIVFLDAALTDAGAVREPFPCSHCGAEGRKRTLERAFVTEMDPVLEKPIRRAKVELALVAYRGARGRATKKADKADRALLRRAEALEIPDWFPVERMGDGDEGRRNDAIGLTHLHHFFTRRALASLAALWAEARRADRRVRDYLLFTVEQNIWGMSRLARYVPTHFSQVNQYLSGTLYVGSQVVDVAPEYILEGKIARLTRVLAAQRAFGPGATVWCGSLTATPCPDNAVDYIFVDPPFGANLSYSDLNFLWEAWLRVRTNVRTEAVVSTAHAKGLGDYQALMTACFRECYRILKPGRWMTVEFHNSRNAVWTAIQEALSAAGFVIADVRVLDKQHRTFKQLTGAGAVKNDLILSAYKPHGPLLERFQLEAGTEEGAWDFVRSHLAQLPVFLSRDGRAELIAERQNYLLFDRMVAFHVQRGVTVPLSAAAFYAGLPRRFPERDGMYFLPDQVAEHDRQRMSVTELLQLDLFVSDEASAIQWLKQQLALKPQTFQEIHPRFMQELAGWQKHEKPLELSELLEQNFLRHDGRSEVPTQIHAYLSTNFRELRNRPKDDAALQSHAKDRWYVPDPNKAGDLEKLRERALSGEFTEYRQSKQRRLPIFRLEAVRAGFKKAWTERDYETILAVAGKLPEAVLQEDAKLLMWLDQARTRLGAE
jgi:hypothetical protein